MSELKISDVFKYIDEASYKQTDCCGVESFEFIDDADELKRIIKALNDSKVDKIARLIKDVESYKFKINRLEQYIMVMGYGLPSMGDSDSVNWITPKADIKLLREQLLLSTDRLNAIWSNTGSMGAKSQADANVEALAATGVE